MNALVSQELSRCRSLLSPRRARTQLAESAPEPAPESIGALGGLGLTARAPDVRASVYVFTSQSEHAAAVTKLTATVPKEGREILHGSNGRLLFFGWTRTDGPDGVDAKYRLADLISAFSGDE